MRDFCVIDCETDPFAHGEQITPFIWGCYSGGDYETFETCAELVEYVSAKKWIVYAHNGGKFDYIFLAPYFTEYEKILMINGRIAKAKLGAAELRDSFCILPVPLAQINKDEFDYNKMKKEVRHKYMKEIKAYLFNDCYYLYEAIAKFREGYGDNLTIAGAAMKQWCKISDQKPERTKREYFQEMESFYYGGRVECFESGIIEGDIMMYDINSAYPHAMVHDHPSGRDYTFSIHLPKDDDTLSRALIALRCRARGQFPQKTKQGIHFPADNELRDYTITGWEYIAARDCGLLDEVKIDYCYIFQRRVNFTPYVDIFWKKKDDAKKAGDAHNYLYAKLFLNSLYGKFGSNPQNYKENMIAPRSHIDALEEEGWTPARPIDDKTFFEKPLEEIDMRFYNVATAASITGFVRAKLLKALHGCDRALYCDTDSIMCIGGNDLALSDKLGDWGIDAHGARVAIAGKKLYALAKKDGTYKAGKKYKTATKGARLSAKDIFRIARGGVVNYKSESPSMSLKNVSYIYNENKKEIEIQIKYIERNIKATYKTNTATLRNYPKNNLKGKSNVS